MKKWKDIRHKLGPDREAAVARLRDEIVAEQKTLRELRDLMGITQEELARRLESSQSHLSQFETREDRKLSNLRRYVEALGGKLRVQAEIDGKVINLAVV